MIVLTSLPAIAAAHETAAATTEAGLKPNQVVTIAGTGEAGYSGDGGDALDARVGDALGIAVGPGGFGVHRRPGEGWIFSPRNTPHAVAVGQDGTAYVAASENIYWIDPDGSTEVIGGGGEERVDGGEGEDGGPAVGAWIYEPNDVAVDAGGNVYIADGNNQRIRRIDTDGTLTTIAGGGNRDIHDAVGGPATEAEAGDVGTVAVDSQGNVYFGHSYGYQPYVWKVNPDGTLSIAAGTGEEGFSGDGGPAVDAQLRSPPGGLAVDAGDNLYLTDLAAGHVRRIDNEGVITTVGPAVTDTFGDVAVDSDGDLYVTAGAQVRMLVRSAEEPEPPARVEAGEDPWAGEEPGTVIAVAGTGRAPEPDSTAVPQLQARRPWLRSVAVGADGSLVFSDPARNQVLRVTADRAVSTVAGMIEPGFSGDGGPATDAQLSMPSGVAFDADGNLYIADTGNRRIRVVDTSGVITTVAGSGRAADADDEQALGDGGAATDAMLVGPQDVAVSADGQVYIADGRGGRIRMVDADGTIRTIAGGGDWWADQADGRPATEADLWEPNTVAVDAGGNVYFAGERLPSVRKVDPDGTLTTVAGDAYLEPGEGGFGGDGGPATQAELNAPGDLAIDADGTLHIADTLNGRVRKVGADGVITTVAGTGERRESGDDGPATSAAVNEPEALAFDADGNLYLTGTGSDRIRRVGTDGVITTVADLIDDERTDGSRPAVETPLGRPLGIAVDRAGALYVAETQTGLVRSIEPGGGISTVAPLSAHPGEMPVHVTAVASGSDGFLYVAARGAVLKVYPDGAVVTVAGGGINPEPPDTLPQATTATLAPVALATDPNGALYIADAQHGQVFRLDRDGGLTSVADVGGLGQFTGMAADSEGNVYVPDQIGSVVRKVTPDGTVRVFAGTGDTYDPDDLGDGGPASDAAVVSPTGVAVDGDDVYISTMHGIRRVDSNGTITMVAESSSEEDSAGTSYEPVDMLAFDAHGNLYVSEMRRNRVRVLVRPGDIRYRVSRAVLIAGGGVAALLAAGAFLVVRFRRRGRVQRRPDMGGTAPDVDRRAGVPSSD